MNPRLLLSVAALLLLQCLPAEADTKYWTGAIDNNWSTPGNWVDGTAPVTGDDVFFWSRFFSDSTVATNNDIGDLVLNSLQIAAVFTAFIFDGEPLSIANGISNYDARHLRWRIPVKLLRDQEFYLRGRVDLDAPIDLNGNVLTLRCHELRFGGARSFTGSGSVLLNGGAVSVMAPGDFVGTFDAGPWEAHLAADFPNARVVKSSGTLTSAGRTKSIEASSTRLRPGHTEFCCPAFHTVGTLSTEDLVVSSGSIEFAAASSNAVPNPTVHDRILVSRRIALSEAPYLSVGFPSYYGPEIGQTYLLIDNAGTESVSGNFARLPEGGSFGGGPTGDVRFTASYKAGDGNDFAISAIEKVKVALRVETVTVAAPHAHVVHAHVDSVDPKRGEGRVYFLTSHGLEISAPVDAAGNSRAVLAAGAPGTFSVWAVYSIDAYSVSAKGIELTTITAVPLSGTASLAIFAVALAVVAWSVLRRP